MSDAPKSSSATRAAGVITIVPYRDEHAQIWRTLNEAWISRFFVLEAKDRETLDNPRGVILDKGGRILIALLDGVPVGCVGLARMADGGFELCKMAVDSAAQGLGVGRRLVEASILLASSLDAPRLYLETNSGLGPAIHIYRSAGFVDLPPQETPYKRCDIWMERRLRRE
ncbi:GNAT family N-acetyltransferase [bacterium]|nr:GNAT family N-acetyltransferase [bacterium]